MFLHVLLLYGIHGICILRLKPHSSQRKLLPVITPFSPWKSSVGRVALKRRQSQQRALLPPRSSIYYPGRPNTKKAQPSPRLNAPGGGGGTRCSSCCASIPPCLAPAFLLVCPPVLPALCKLTQSEIQRYERFLPQDKQLYQHFSFYASNFFFPNMCTMGCGAASKVIKIIVVPSELLIEGESWLVCGQVAVVIYSMSRVSR